MSKANSGGRTGSQLYDQNYYAHGCGDISYDRSEPHWGRFFGTIADELIRTFRPRNVFDAGCAKGFLIEALWDRGVVTYGRDISDYAISEARGDMRSFCSVGSLAQPIEGHYDLITCIEVLEHMNEEEALAAIGYMTSAADRVVFSSSPSDLDEPTHINVKPPIYWIRAFADRGFWPLIETTVFSITPYALAFERRTETTSEDFLVACADVVRYRIKAAEDRVTIHRLSTELNAQRRRAENDLAVAQSAAVAERAALAAELGKALEAKQAALYVSELAANSLQSFLYETMDAYVRLLGMISELERSRSWRAARKITRVMRRLRSHRGSVDPVAEVFAKAKSTAMPAFDAAFYLEQHPQVAAEGIDPLRHYVAVGRAQGFLPNRTGFAHAPAGATPERPGPSEAPKRTVLQLGDLCDPYRREAGAKVTDEAFLITVLTPTYNIQPRYIRELYQSLDNQMYAHWEWVVVDDGSSLNTSVAVLREIAASDDRVKLICCPANCGISGASNLGLTAGQGTYVALVDHDDLVSRHAFLSIYEAWKQAPQTRIFYTDECKLQADDSLTELWAKPDWSPAHLEYTMCLGHLSVYRRDFIEELGGFRSEFDGTQDYDLALRALLRDPIVTHVPIFGYLWRKALGSSAESQDQKPYAIERQRQALLNYAGQRHPGAEVAKAHHDGYWRIRYPLATPPPLLSYVIPAGGGVRSVHGKQVDLIVNCIRSFEEKAFYPNREYVVVQNGRLPAGQIKALNAIPNVRLVVHADPTFNFSRTVNAGVAATQGEYICLVNDDVAAITERGGEELVSYLAVNPGVGIIGPRCLLEDGRIQQSGVILLRDGGPTHAATGATRDFGGHHMNLLGRRETWCIGAAMLVIRKAVYEEVGGFREDLPLNYNDVDFSLRVRDRGYRCVADPDIEVYHFESLTKIGTAMVEQERFYLTRAETRDPYFSRWFNPANPMFEIDLGAPDRALPLGPWLDRHIARRAATGPTTGPKFTICLLVGAEPLRNLDEALRSATMQTYSNVEVLAVDVGVHAPDGRRWFGAIEAKGVIPLTVENDTLEALATAVSGKINGDFVIFLKASDFLSVDALQLLAEGLQNDPSAALFYTDQYEADIHSGRSRPFFKPDFDPILLSNFNYANGWLAARNDIVLRALAAGGSAPIISIDFEILSAALTDSHQPRHIRELAYGRRAGSADENLMQAHKRLVADLIKSGPAVDQISAAPVPGAMNGRLQLIARRPVNNVAVLDARYVWGDDGGGIPALATAAGSSGTEWVAVLLNSPDDPALLKLSAVALFDPGVNVVSGILKDQIDHVVWSGGVFRPNGGIFDPHAGLVITDDGYNALLACQRSVDVAAPVNVLMRAPSLLRVLERFLPLDADGLMVALGLDAIERGERVAVTPYLTAVAPSYVPPPPADRAGLVAASSAGTSGSRWYDCRLQIDPPYTMPGCRR